MLVSLGSAQLVALARRVYVHGAADPIGAQRIHAALVARWHNLAPSLADVAEAVVPALRDAGAEALGKEAAAKAGEQAEARQAAEERREQRARHAEQRRRLHRQAARQRAERRAATAAANRAAREVRRVGDGGGGGNLRLPHPIRAAELNHRPGLQAARVPRVDLGRDRTVKGRPGQVPLQDGSPKGPHQRNVRLISTFDFYTKRGLYMPCHAIHARHVQPSLCVVVEC